VYQCRICNQTGDFPKFSVSEMLMGTGDRFEYFQCPHCGCLQISEFPGDMGKYYPGDYYSFQLPEPKKLSVRNYIRLQRKWYEETGHGIIGCLRFWLTLRNLFRPKPVHSLWEKVPWKTSSRILDVGCGAGTFPHRLYSLGYRHVTGIDPFNPTDILKPFPIYKQTIQEHQGKYDVITLHHSLEHMPDPWSALASVKRLLAPGGIAVVALPLFSPYLFETYGTNWVSWDASRHFYLHTRTSMELLTSCNGLKIKDFMYDTNVWVLLTCDLYKKYGLDLTARKQAEMECYQSREITGKYNEQAKKLNQEQKADWCAFFLTHAD